MCPDTTTGANTVQLRDVRRKSARSDPTPTLASLHALLYLHGFRSASSGKHTLTHTQHFNMASLMDSVRRDVPELMRSYDPDALATMISDSRAATTSLEGNRTAQGSGMCVGLGHSDILGRALEADCVLFSIVGGAQARPSVARQVELRASGSGATCREGGSGARGRGSLPAPDAGETSAGEPFSCRSRCRCRGGRAACRGRAG